LFDTRGNKAIEHTDIQARSKHALLTHPRTHTCTRTHAHTCTQDCGQTNASRKVTAHAAVEFACLRPFFLSQASNPSSVSFTLASEIPRRASSDFKLSWNWLNSGSAKTSP